MRAQGIGTVRTPRRAASPPAPSGRTAPGASSFPARWPSLDQGETLEAGGSTKVAFAVWEGGSGERAGIKAFSKQWRELTLEG